MYPKLAKAYPTNKLPDLRGEFIRGWDDGRAWMRDVPCYLHRMVNVEVIIGKDNGTLGLVIQSKTDYDQIVSNQAGFPTDYRHYLLAFNTVMELIPNHKPST